MKGHHHEGCSPCPGHMNLSLKVMDATIRPAHAKGSDASGQTRLRYLACYPGSNMAALDIRPAEKRGIDPAFIKEGLFPGGRARAGTGELGTGWTGRDENGESAKNSGVAVTYMLPYPRPFKIPENRRLRKKSRI